jgi:Protein of unknown function (DUF3667)
LFSNEKERQLVFFVLIFKKNFTVSHVPQRKEKDCLNCGTIVQGRYCHVCGQENVVPKETFWHMVTHFFYDITHFDSNFFETVKDLILHPGFLSKEYMLGRRAKYLHPVRMYVFTSAVFFLMFFSFSKGKESIGGNINKPLDGKQRIEYRVRLENQLKDDPGNKKLLSTLALVKDTTRPLTVGDIIGEQEGGLKISFSDNKYQSEKEYDSAQKALPPEQRDGWFKKRLVRKEIDINQKYRENPKEAITKLGESLLHRLPYMLLVSLPLFALILKLVYMRRKQFYFADHGVFTIHVYVFSFLVLMAVFGLDKLDDWFNWDFVGWGIAALFIWQIIYLYKAMRNFYGQRRAKTFFKFLIVALGSFIMLLVLFALFMFFSAYTL